VRGIAGRLASQSIAGWFPLSSCQGHLPDWHIYNCIAEIYYNYFNFAEARREQNENKQRNASAGV